MKSKEESSIIISEGLEGKHHEVLGNVAGRTIQYRLLKDLGFSDVQAAKKSLLMKAMKKRLTFAKWFTCTEQRRISPLSCVQCLE